MTIWKFQLSIRHGSQSASLPVGAKVLSARNQSEMLVVYALISDCPPGHRIYYRDHQFYVAMTGQPIENGGNAFPDRFVDTVLFEAGSLVVHVFDLDK